MTPEEAAHLQHLYHMARREWACDPSNGLHPYPQRRTSKRKPVPGVLDVDAEDDG